MKITIPSKSQPVGCVAAAQVNDQRPATGLGIASLQILLQFQVLEGTVFPPVGKADDGIVTGEGQSAGESG